MARHIKEQLLEGVIKVNVSCFKGGQNALTRLGGGTDLPD